MEERLNIKPISELELRNEVMVHLLKLDEEIKTSGHGIWAAISGEELESGAPRLMILFMDLGTTNEIGSLTIDHEGAVLNREGVGREFLNEETG